MQTLEFMQFHWLIIITLNFQRIAFLICLNCSIGQIMFRHSNPPLPVSCRQVLNNHYTIQAGPNIYWSKVKLLTIQYVYIIWQKWPNYHPCMVFPLLSQTVTQHGDATYMACWRCLQWMNETTTRCGWHGLVWLTINWYILYGAQVTLSVNQCVQR